MSFSNVKSYCIGLSPTFGSVLYRESINMPYTERPETIAMSTPNGTKKAARQSCNNRRATCKVVSSRIELESNL